MPTKSKGKDEPKTKSKKAFFSIFARFTRQKATVDEEQLSILLEEEEEEEEDTPPPPPPVVPKGRIQGIAPVAPELSTAEGLMAQHARIAEAKPFEKFVTALEKAIDRIKGMMDSRIGKDVMKPLAAQRKALWEAMQEADKKARILGPLVEPYEGRDPSVPVELSKTELKRLTKASDELKAALDGLVDAAKNVGPAVIASQQVIEKHIKKEIKANIGKNYANLHPRTVAVFDGLEKANKVLSITIGLAATAAGHPEVGGIVKGVISAALTTVRKGTETVQKYLDGKDEELAQMSQNLLSHDKGDVLTVEKLKQYGNYARKAVGIALAQAGVEVDLLADIRKIVPDVDKVLDSVYDKLQEIVSDKPELVDEDNADEAAEKLSTAASSAVNTLIDKLAEKKGGKLDAKINQLLSRLESKVRGTYKEEGMDLDSELEGLEDILDELYKDE
ncbi:MAG: hypothetical protein H6732_11530 [Alphaproteobacteria bacterium]|nr:hypothetical protein [Alphaproteobacteria bacterium]